DVCSSDLRAVRASCTCATQDAHDIPSMARSTSRISAPHQSCDGLGGLTDLLLPRLVRCSGGIHDAVPEVLLDEAEAHRLERPRDRCDLGEDVDAVRVLVHHAGDAPHLALDTAQPLEVVVLAAAVPRHRIPSRPADYSTPVG